MGEFTVRPTRLAAVADGYEVVNGRFKRVTGHSGEVDPFATQMTAVAVARP